MTAAYPPPVDRLLTLGKATLSADWPEYRDFGLRDEHVPDLVRMATDEELLWAEVESDEVWPPIHAWRALGQLRAETAVEPLAELLAESDDNEWALAELPRVFGMIGRPAVPALAALLADRTAGLWPRVAAVESLKSVTEADAEARTSVVDPLSRQLERWKDEDEILNAIVISVLADLGVTEAVPVMEAAFAADGVDVSWRGDWEDVQIDMGLLAERITPRPDYHAEMWRRWDLTPPRPAKHRPSPKDKAKAKRKAAKESRKRNRRRR